MPTTGTVTGLHQYSDDAGWPYTVTVSVMSGTDTGTGSFQVTDAPPVVTPDSETLTGNEGSLVTLGATYTDLGFNYGGTIKSFTATIDWGDGTSSSVGTVTVNSGNATTPTTEAISAIHTYATFGTYPITIQLTDEAGVTGMPRCSATINDLAPVAAPLPGGTFVLNTDPTTLYPTIPRSRRPIREHRSSSPERSPTPALAAPIR